MLGLLGLGAATLAAAGFFALGCCSPVECASCPPAFCRQTITTTPPKAQAATPAPAPFLFVAVSGPLSPFRPALLFTPLAAFSGASIPLRN